MRSAPLKSCGSVYFSQPCRKSPCSAQQLFLPAAVWQQVHPFLSLFVSSVFPKVNGVATLRVEQSQRVWHSHTSRGEVLAPGHTAGLYEPRAAPDGTRGVLFLDGRVARLPEAEWERLRRASGVQ